MAIGSHVYALLSYTYIPTGSLLADSKDCMCVADSSARFVIRNTLIHCRCNILDRGLEFRFDVALYLQLEMHS